MATTDPLIRWETEALRESAARRHDPRAAGSPRSRKKDAWVTLRDAHYETGLPVETLRKWARRNHVPSEIRTTEFGERRVIDLVAVEQRAIALGRALRPVPASQRDHDGPVPAATPGVDDVVAEIRDEEVPPSDADGATAAPTDHEPDDASSAFEPPSTERPSTQPPSGDTPAAQDAHTSAAADAPAGTMIVPIAAWDRMLMQLGNLHEAGQQLADARERAAKAETESMFLRERLAELREAMEPAPSQPEVAGPAPSPTTRDRPETMWRYVLRGWKQRKQ